VAQTNQSSERERYRSLTSTASKGRRRPINEMSVSRLLDVSVAIFDIPLFLNSIIWQIPLEGNRLAIRMPYSAA
jgi:hypothetical protein